MNWIFSLLGTLFGGGNIIKQFTDPLLKAIELRNNAANDQQRIDAELVIAKLEAARDIALAEASDRWSATRIGRLLIVVPFGIWWVSVIAVSIINPLLGWNIGHPSRLIIEDIPPQFWGIAKILIPAIIIGDASALITRKIGGR